MLCHIWLGKGKTDLMLLNEIFSDKFSVPKKKELLPSLSETSAQGYSKNLLPKIISQFLEDNICWVTRVDCCWRNTYFIFSFLCFMLKINGQFLTMLLGIHNKRHSGGGNITVPSPIVHDFNPEC